MMRVLDEVRARHDDLIAFTQQLVRTPSLSGQEGDVAELVRGRLESFGLSEVWTDEVGNVIAVLRGQGGGPDILLNGHMDVVPEGRRENWAFDPYAAQIDAQGRMHGRGTADMKGGLAVLVYTMKLFKELSDSGLTLPGDLIFSAVVSEEPAEMLGMGHLCDSTLPGKGLTFDLCLQAEPTNGQLNLGHRGKVELVVTTRGKSVHSSRPWQGINALEKMMPVLDHVFNEMNPNLPGHPILGKCSVTVTNLICRPGTMSIVPDECEISVDRRYLPGQSLDELVAEFDELLNELTEDDPDFRGSVRVRTNLETAYTGVQKEVAKHHPAWIMPEDHPMVLQAQSALQGVGQAGVLGYFTGGTDGGYPAGLMGIPTIGFSHADESLAHTETEHLALEALLRDAEGYAAMLYAFFDLPLERK